MSVFDCTLNFCILILISKLPNLQFYVKFLLVKKILYEIQIPFPQSQKPILYFKRMSTEHDIPIGLKLLIFYCNDTRPDFAGGGPVANTEDGSSLIIHWSSGSHKR